MLGEAFSPFPFLSTGGSMAVRDALLALLTAGPAYGFQLHGGIIARTGGRRTGNVGQTYATLERPARQGLIEPAGATDDGLPLHRLTAAGREAAVGWLHGADASGSDPWDETIDRVLIARSLPECDAATVVAEERDRWSARRDVASARVEHATRDGTAGTVDAEDEAEADLARLAASADLHRAHAALAWIDAVAAADRLAYPPKATRPKRGRRPAARSSADTTAREAAQPPAIA
ncbi:PadR family transcriptional regulator [Agromyces sp. Marseille-P2726]|uniref:PadR family transcriptional regulator n=1 Tax=Agromyces sp. Marseille-P2726 TaxID=2709132 RepID=UPI00156F0079|nr:PadR family transcriptional regulator [Agromyces sp. Marseille-P2726]